MVQFNSSGPRSCRGQVTVVAAAVVALIVGVGLAVALVAAAIVDRTASTAAADAVALADIVDPAAGDRLGAWYRSRGFVVEASGGMARASGSAAQARSRAEAVAELRVAPVVLAVVARAEQLLGLRLEVVEAEGVSVTFSGASARRFDAVAAELGMCAAGEATFERC